MLDRSRPVCRKCSVRGPMRRRRRDPVVVVGPVQPRIRSRRKLRCALKDKALAPKPLRRRRRSRVVSEKRRSRPPKPPGVPVCLRRPVEEKGPEVLVRRPVRSGLHQLPVYSEPKSPLYMGAGLVMPVHWSGASLVIRRGVDVPMPGYLHLYRRVVPRPRKKAMYAVG